MGDLRLPERRQPVRHLQRCGSHPRLRRLHGGRRRRGLLRVHRGAGGLRLRAREAAGLEVAGHGAAGVLRPHRSAGDRGRCRQDRRIRRQGGGQRPLRRGLPRQRHQHGRAHAHGPLRDGIPGHPGCRRPAERTELREERPDVRQPPHPGDRRRRLPGSELPHGPGQLHPQLHDVRPDRRHGRSGHVLELGRRVGADGIAQPGPLHDPDQRRRLYHRRHLPGRLREPQRPAPGAADPHPGQARLPAEPDAAGCGRQRRHRRADPAGLPEEQHRDRGLDGG